MTDWIFDGLDRNGYDIIIADPPWHFKLRSPKGGKKGAMAHYDLMPTGGIAAMPVRELATPNCTLFLWATSPCLLAALAVMQAWGFEYKSMLVWRKLTEKNRKVRFGTGFRARSGHEVVLIGGIGALNHKPMPSIFDGIARQHSRKPDSFYDAVILATPGKNRVDLFSRESRQGFSTWGNEKNLFD